ncbi:hypothetical protein ACC756_17110 [Rhizobium ruizarguesonis]
MVTFYNVEYSPEGMEQASAYYDERVAEIERGLAPVLNEMELSVRIVAYSSWDRFVFYRDDAAASLSVVELWFPSMGFSGLKQASWADCGVYARDPGVRPVGSNGWVYYQPSESEEPFKPKTMERAIELLTDLLRTEPLYPTARNVPGVTNRADLEGFWYLLERDLASRYGITEYELRREADSTEIVSFICDDSIVEIVLPLNHDFARVRVDGAEVGEADQEDPQWLMDVIHEEMPTSGRRLART